jgi:purine-binding chemotaxis protein CheW
MDQLCTFDVGKLFLGLELSSVQEILRAQPITHVPLTPSVVRGLMSLRGQIVPVLDLRERLGLPADPAAEPFHVLVRTAAGPVSLLVDRVQDVVEVDSALFEPAPETLPAELRGLIRGAYKLQKRLLLALDPVVAVHVEI